jgi:hypothetical protein
MAIFVESPWPFLLLGIAVQIVLAITLLVTRRGMWLWWMLGALGLMLAGELVQWLVVTDREAIRDTIYDSAAAAEANDLERLLSHISPTAVHIRSDARFILGRVEIQLVRVTDLKIAVDWKAHPRTAEATFNVIGRGRDRRGEVPQDVYGSKMVVHLRPEKGGWLVTDYRAEDLKLPR